MEVRWSWPAVEMYSEGARDRSPIDNVAIYVLC